MIIDIKLSKEEHDMMAKTFAAFEQKEMAKSILERKDTGVVMNNGIVMARLDYVSDYSTVITYEVNPEFHKDLLLMAITNAPILKEIGELAARFVKVTGNAINGILAQTRLIEAKYRKN